jgi:HD-GYP domain-containing protein (c-di-GMP phosphodiesterase class II)
MSKILLVEADEAFLLATAELISSDFDEVLQAGPTTPYEDARRLWEHHSDIRVALVGLKIPGPNGEGKNVTFGYQLVSELKALRSDARVGILTGHSDHQYLARAIESGADQFLSKRSPALARRAAACFLNAWVTSASALHALTESIVWRDPYTAGHSLRVRDYCLEIARVLDLADGNTFDLAACKVGAELHDLGKIEIPDDILLSADRLSEEQHQVMQRHVTAVRELGRLLGPEFQSVGELAYQHHRAYSNTAKRGVTDYPKDDQLPRKDEQPLVVRVMHVADVLDALLSDRSYRSGWPLETAIKIIQNEATNGAFDPRVVAALAKFLETDMGKARLSLIQQQGRIIDSANHFLDVYFGDRRLTPGRLRTLLSILSDLYLRNGKAADVLSVQEIVLGDFSAIKKGATIRIRLGGKPEDLAQAEQTLKHRMKETNWCGDQLKADASEIPDEIRDLVARNVREIPLHVARVNRPARSVRYEAQVSAAEPSPAFPIARRGEQTVDQSFQRRVPSGG